MGADNSRLFFALLSIGSAIGIGNIWLYPFFSFRLTGLFFIPYAIALALLGMPLLMLEFSAGQMYGRNVVDSFASIRKWLSCAGWLMAFNAFIVMSFYAVLLSWHIVYFFASIGLQWRNDAKAYFFSNVLQASGGMKGFLQFSLPIFIALVIAWIAVFLCIRKGLESMKKAFITALPALTLLAIFFLFYSLTLENSLQGVYSFLKPRTGNLLKVDTWIAAFSLAATSLGLALGVMPALGRKSGKGFIAGNAFAVAAFKLLSGIAIGFVMAGILGFMGARQHIGVEKLAFSDFGSFFTVLAQAIPSFYKPMLLSLMFFLFFSIFFLLGAASLAYSLLDVLSQKLSSGQRNAAVIVAGLGFLLGLLFITKPGFYIIDIVSHFAYYNILAVLLLEAVAIGWLSDAKKVADYISYHSFLKLGLVWKVAVRYFIPVAITALLALRIKSDYRLAYHGYPLWAVLAFGVGTIVVPMAAAFLMPRRILDRR